MVSGLISGSEHIKALTQHPTPTSKPNEAQTLQQLAAEAGCLEAAFLEVDTSSAAAEMPAAWSDVSTSSLEWKGSKGPFRRSCPPRWQARLPRRNSHAALHQTQCSSLCSRSIIPASDGISTHKQSSCRTPAHTPVKGMKKGTME